MKPFLFFMLGSFALLACSDLSHEDSASLIQGWTQELPASSDALSSSGITTFSSSSVPETSSSSSEIPQSVADNPVASSSSSSDTAPLSSSSSSSITVSNSSSSESSSSSLVASLSSSSVAASSSSGISGLRTCSHTEAGTTGVLDCSEYKYATVKVNDNVWMAENLRYPTSSGSWCKSDANTNSVTNATTYCTDYGRVYDWVTAMQIDAIYATSSWSSTSKRQGICPDDWHLPSNAEWATLLTDLQCIAPTCDKLLGPNPFNAELGGYMKNTGEFANVGSAAAWWTSSESADATSYFRWVNSSDASLSGGGNYKTSGFAVRCVKNTP